MKRIFLLILMSFFMACEDDGPTGTEEHVEAEGLRLYVGPQVVMEYFKGSWSLDTLLSPAGGSLMHTAKLLDEDTLEITDIELEVKFSAEFADTSIADIYWNVGEEGSFEFYILGKKLGNTSVVFKTLHGDHSDFITVPVGVKIAPVF